MKINLTENESIFCQAIANVSLLAALSNNNFLKSEYFQKMKLANTDENHQNIKTILTASGLGNPAMLQMFMYSLLVIPKELLKNDYCGERFNEKVLECAPICHSTYEGEEDNKDVNYYRHIRNAIAHSRCKYSVENGVTYVEFSDWISNARNRSEKSINCTIKMKTMDVGMLFEFLMRELMKILNKTITKNSNE